MTTLDLTTTQPLPVQSQRRKHKAGDAISEKVERRHLEVAEAAQLRAYETNPDVVAWRVERTHRLVEGIVYAAVLAGLAFTMVNVQQFAAGNTTSADLAWWAAWLLDPIVSLVLIAILIAGRSLTKAGVGLGNWSRFAQWSLLAATYTMNTWQSWAKGNLDQIVLHSVPPLVVFMSVEVLAELRERFAVAVDRAHAQAVEAAGERQKAATPPPPKAETPAPVEAGQPEAKPAGDGRPDGTPRPDALTDEWIAYAAKVVAELDAKHGRVVGRSIVQPALGVGTPAATALLRAVRDANDAPRLAAVR